MINAFSLPSPGTPLETFTYKLRKKNNELMRKTCLELPAKNTKKIIRETELQNIF